MQSPGTRRRSSSRIADAGRSRPASADFQDVESASFRARRSSSVRSSPSSSATRSTTVPSGRLVGSSRTSRPFSTRARTGPIWLLCGFRRGPASRSWCADGKYAHERRTAEPASVGPLPFAALLRPSDSESIPGDVLESIEKSGIVTAGATSFLGFTMFFLYAAVTITREAAESRLTDRPRVLPVE